MNIWSSRCDVSTVASLSVVSAVAIRRPSIEYRLTASIVFPVDLTVSIRPLKCALTFPNASDSVPVWELVLMLNSRHCGASRNASAIASSTYRNIWAGSSPRQTSSPSSATVLTPFAYMRLSDVIPSMAPLAMYVRDAGMCIWLLRVLSLNAYAPMVSMQSCITASESRSLSPLNMKSAMAVHRDGRISVVSFSHPKNAPRPMDAVASGSSTRSRLLHPEKAHSPISVSLSDFVASTLFIPDPKNALSPMVVSSSPHVTDSRALHPAKASAPMAVTISKPLVFSRSVHPEKSASAMATGALMSIEFRDAHCENA